MLLSQGQKGNGEAGLFPEMLISQMDPDGSNREEASWKVVASSWKWLGGGWKWLKGGIADL